MSRDEEVIAGLLVEDTTLLMSGRDLLAQTIVDLAGLGRDLSDVLSRIVDREVPPEDPQGLLLLYLDLAEKIHEAADVVVEQLDARLGRLHTARPES